jgi:hypothetical protein
MRRDPLDLERLAARDASSIEVFEPAAGAAGAAAAADRSILEFIFTLSFYLRG